MKRCSDCGKTFELWPVFHYWFTRMGTRLICQGRALAEARKVTDV